MTAAAASPTATTTTTNTSLTSAVTLGVTTTVKQDCHGTASVTSVCVVNRVSDVYALLLFTTTATAMQAPQQHDNVLHCHFVSEALEKACSIKLTRDFTP